MEDKGNSGEESFGSRGLRNVEQYEAEYMPLKIKIKDAEGKDTEDAITLDRRLTKVFPISDETKHISYVFIPSSGENPHDKGQFIIGGATWEINHEQLYEFAKETGILSNDSPEPTGGGILTKERGRNDAQGEERYYFDRESDLYGDVDNKLAKKTFVKGINREYIDLF